MVRTQTERSMSENVSVLFTHHSAVRWWDDTAVERDEAAAYEGLEEAGKTAC